MQLGGGIWEESANSRSGATASPKNREGPEIESGISERPKGDGVDMSARVD